MFSAEASGLPLTVILVVVPFWPALRSSGNCGPGAATLTSVDRFVYVLSFYEAARKSPSFRQALGALERKLVGGQVVVENPHRGLAKLGFCRKGEPSRLATNRYREILKNVGA